MPKTAKNRPSVVVAKTMGVDPTEWLAVYHGFFGDDCAKCKWSVRRVSCWSRQAHRTRRKTLCPVYAEATSTVMAVILSESVVELTPEAKAVAYVGALLRVVTLLTQSAPGTYRERAIGVGLPTEVAELRNMAAHGQVPPLPLLQWIALTALRYLKDECWDVDKPAVEEQNLQRADDLETEIERAANQSVALDLPVLSLEAILEKIGHASTKGTPHDATWH